MYHSLLFLHSAVSGWCPSLGSAGILGKKDKAHLRVYQGTEKKLHINTIIVTQSCLAGHKTVY